MDALVSALIRKFKTLNYRTLVILALVGLLLVPAVVVAVAVDLPALSGEAADVVAGDPGGEPEPGPGAWTDGFVWGG